MSNLIGKSVKELTIPSSKTTILDPCIDSNLTYNIGLKLRGEVNMLMLNVFTSIYTAIIRMT